MSVAPADCSYDHRPIQGGNEVICFGAPITDQLRGFGRKEISKDRTAGAQSPNDSTNLDPVFLGERWNDTVQAQVRDELSVMVGNVPDRNDRDPQFGARSGIAALDTVERIVRCERGEDAVRVIERILEVLNQLGFTFRRIVPALFAIVGRLLALKFIEEGKLSAGNVLHLFSEGADAIEIAACRDVGILVLRHGFSYAEKIPFRKLERAADALRDGFGNVIRRGGLLGRRSC